MVKVLFCCFSLHSFQFVIQNKMKEKKNTKFQQQQRRIQKQSTIWTLWAEASAKWVYEIIYTYIRFGVCMCSFIRFDALFSYPLFILYNFFLCEHTHKKGTPNETILRATNQTIITIFFFFVHYSGVVIGRIQGRCECTYIRTPANNTLTENQNEQIATAKKDKRKRKINVRKMKKKTKTSNKKTASFFVESF